MKNIRRLFAVLFAVLFVVTAIPLTAMAANGTSNLSISLDKTEVSATGDVVTITLSNAAMTVSSIAGGIGFDTTEATCLSITGSRSTGTAYLFDTAGDAVAATATATTEDANQYGYASFALAGATDTPYQAGVILTATFQINSEDGATFTLFEDSYGTDGCLIDPADTKTVTIAPELTGISIKTAPSKTSYYVGDVFSIAGLVVSASYSDNTSVDVTGYSVSTPDMTTVGVQTITVTYGEMTATFTITVNEVVEELVVGSITASDSGFIPNDVVTWTVNTTGGTGELTYYYTVYRNGNAYRNFNDKTSNVLEYTLPDVGTYKIRVRVKNGDGTYTSYTYSEEITVYAAPTVIAIPSTSSAQEVGDTNTWTVVTGGGVGELTYFYQIYRNGNAYRTIGWSSSNTVEYTYQDYGTYVLRVRVKDSMGNYSEYYNGGSVKVTFPAAVIESVEADAASKNVGESLTWTATATGGTGDLTYYYTVYRDGKGIRSYTWTSSNELTYTPTQAGTYTVRVRVKDSYGKLSSFYTGGSVVVE